MRFKKLPRYAIKSDYEIRNNNQGYFDGTSFDDGLVYQPHVYQLARYLAEKGDLEYVIDIGAGNGEKLKKNLKGYKIIAIDCEVNLKELKDNLPGQEVIDYDLEKGLPYISEEILRKSVVISSDVIEHIVNLDGYLKGLKRYSRLAPFVLISTPDRDRARGIDDVGPPANQAHVREWTAAELHSLLANAGLSNPRTGYTINTNVHREKSTILTIGGAHNLCRDNKPTATKSVLAIMTVFNEEDVVEHSLRNLLSQGVDVHVIDNWSTDNSPKLVKSISKEYPDRVFYEKFPKTSTKNYEWTKLLNRVDEVARQSSYDWIIHHDADEVRESPHPRLTIVEAITTIDDLGYNAIDHTVVDMRPTRDGFTKNSSLNDYFTHFEYGKRPGHFLQTKGWKNNNTRVGLSDSGGHSIELENLKVYPIKFLLKHYPLRSSTQARKKIFAERKPRISKAEAKKGWHIQYNQYKESSEFVWKADCLKKFHKIMFWQEEMVEQISGIGIVD